MTVQELADHVGDRIMMTGAYADPIALMERGVHSKITGDLRGPTAARPSIPSDPQGAGASHYACKDRNAARFTDWSDVAALMGL